MAFGLVQGMDVHDVQRLGGSGRWWNRKERQANSCGEYIPMGQPTFAGCGRPFCSCDSPSRIRTYDLAVNSRIREKLLGY